MIYIEIFIILIGKYLRFTSKANVRLFNVFQPNKVEYDISISLTDYVVRLFVFIDQFWYGRVIGKFCYTQSEISHIRAARDMPVLS